MSKKKELILYIFFGVLTTIVNIFSYTFLVLFANINYLFGNGIAWFLSVIFAYITNRKWVFESENKDVLKELTLFISSRLLVGVIDMLFLFLLVDVFLVDIFTSKIITQVIVVFSNYTLSKLVIFK
ncbi:MAG: GtrA family protein [Methanobacteriaceae archaeon]|jgi:putative flippase GtrA|nr:GtrA family protein [Methanobacteriaceae archaeon]